MSIHSGIVEIEELTSKFLRGFKDDEGHVKYEKRISEVIVNKSRSLKIDFQDLYSYDTVLGRGILQDPKPYVEAFQRNAFSILRMRSPEYADYVKTINVRFRDLPIGTQLRKIGAEHIGILIMTNGIIVNCTSVKPYITSAIFKCIPCGEDIVIPQIDETLLTPKDCPSCNSRRGFMLLPLKSTFINTQRMTIQEKQEDLPAGQLPRRLIVEVTDDLVDISRPGDRINITGSIDLLKIIGRGGVQRTFNILLNANNVELIDKELELEITEEDEQKIKELSEDPGIFRNLLQSIAPSIYGLEEIKEAILYLLFGGVPKELSDMRIRGDLNVLLLGDPGTGKSQLLQFASTTAPRGILTTGRGSTAAGLTAAVVKEGGQGSYILEAGALVLGDKGVCCIDEMDKMRDEDRGAIHPAMEQQIVSIAKGGIVATLNARTSILAAANPILGRYNPYQSMAQNINLPVTLLSRFDLIFILRDLPEAVKDRKMARHILTLHMTSKSKESPLDHETLRKYISYSKRVEPSITPEVVDYFSDFYIKMRTASIEGGEMAAISITARQLESLVRMSEARARAHLRDEVSVEDAEAVIALMQRSLEQVGIDIETGKVDIDLIFSGKPRSLQVQLQKVLEAIGDHNIHTGEPMRDSDLFDCMLSDHQLGRSEVARLIGVLMRDGTIFAPRAGSYKRTN